MIDACKKKQIVFFYGISPGLDISYSNKDDLNDLNAKLEQVRSLGCEAFALLWDDIDTTLPLADRRTFKSLAEAHVKVTNSTFERLDRPNFLTCPVEYCASRADPNVADSEYLNDLGVGLDADIKIFWTGAKVVSEVIGKDELVEINRVLRRSPVLWDNLHANDYDQQRMFLGPYSGRDPEIISHLSGVMTNPNCEYSFNVPALFTLAAWSECFDSKSRVVTRGWNPVAASNLAIPHFLEEIRRPTQIGVHDARPEVADNVEITKADVELLFHLFWLPHSHGPKAEMLINEFKYLRDHAHLVLKYGYEVSSDSEDEDDIVVNANHGLEPEFLDQWMERASSFNNVCKRFLKLCDKFTFIDNRQLFFDANAYLSNLQVILSGCNRFLKWVGLERCRKPINGGPTLAGLPGGVAGELQRLFPVKCNFEYPIRVLRPSCDKNCYQIRPMAKEDFEDVADAFPKLLGDALGVDASELGLSARRFATKTKCRVFLDQVGVSRCLVVERDDVLEACLVGARNVKQVVEDLEEAFQSAKEDNDDIGESPVTMPKGGKSDIPWTALLKYEAVIAITSSQELLFSNTLKNAIKLLLMLLNDCKSACIVVERPNCITRSFLKTLKFKEIHRGEKFGVMAFECQSCPEKMEEP